MLRYLRRELGGQGAYFLTKCSKLRLRVHHSILRFTIPLEFPHPLDDPTCVGQEPQTIEMYIFAGSETPIICCFVKNWYHIVSPTAFGFPSQTAQVLG